MKPKISKNEHFLTLDTHTYVCVSRSKKCSYFVKFGVLLFSGNHRFEIRPFTLLLTNWKIFSNFFLITEAQSEFFCLHLRAQMCNGYKDGEIIGQINHRQYANFLLRRVSRSRDLRRR